MEKELTPYDCYIKDVLKYPILTPSDEKELLKGRLTKPAAREALINCNLRFVINIAKQFHVKNKLPLLDLISAGNMGLIRATDKFKIEKGVRLLTYAKWWIIAGILREIEKWEKNNYPEIKNGKFTLHEIFYENSLESPENFEAEDHEFQKYASKAHLIIDFYKLFEKIKLKASYREILIQLYGLYEEEEKTLKEIADKSKRWPCAVLDTKRRAEKELRANELFQELKEYI